jgi:hypothetical protein
MIAVLPCPQEDLVAKLRARTFLLEISENDLNSASKGIGVTKVWYVDSKTQNIELLLDTSGSVTDAIVKARKDGTPVLVFSISEMDPKAIFLEP